MKLNIGAGYTSVEEFKNVDVRELPGIDIVASAENLDFAKDGEVDEILCSHMLEHYSYYRTPIVIREWYRVLKSSGILYVAVPDMSRVIEFIAQYGWGEWAEKLIFGDQDYEWGAHESGFDYEYLKTALELAGFDSIRRVEKFPVEIKGKTATEIRFPDRIKSEGDSLSLNVIARKP